MLCVLNLGEEDAARMAEVEEKYRTGPLTWRAEGIAVTVTICGKIEAELLAELPKADAAEYLKSYGLQESALERLIAATLFAVLGLMSFLTMPWRNREVTRVDDPHEQHRAKSRGRHS